MPRGNGHKKGKITAGRYRLSPRSEPYDRKRDEALDFPPDDWEQREADERYEPRDVPVEPRGDGSLHA